MRLVYAIIILVSLVVIGSSLYHVYDNLGGFEPVEVYKLEPIKRTMVGKQFKTRYTDKVIEEQFVKSRELIASNQIDGELAAVTYLQDSLAGNEIDQFVGIVLKEDMAEIPVDFDVREFESKTRYVVFLSMHPLVRPKAEQLESMLHAKAQEDGFELRDYFFEIHYQDNSMSLEGWVK
ncbi:MAG: hypothetical protein JXR03_01490 [Cyclobacteriaceae bacterium]